MIRTKNELKTTLKLYFSSVLIYSLGILLFRYYNYYQRTLTSETQTALLYLYLSYLILSPIYYFLAVKESSVNKPYLIIRTAKTYFTSLFSEKKYPGMEKQEKVAILFLFVKIYFLPPLLNFFFDKVNYFRYNYGNYDWYVFSLAVLFGIDTLIFSLGYMFEFPQLNNVVKSVEPTFFGWLVAIICYPPLSSLLNYYIPWGANDYVSFWSPNWTFAMRIMLIFLVVIFVWATVTLGPKSSNLTNRGIVSRFPYSLIRHPAYTSKVLFWWLTLLPVMTTKFTLGMLFWTVIYFFRAITEEKHLGMDPAYLKYCKKVKYRFIPYII